MANYIFSSLEDIDRQQFILNKNEAVFPHPLYGEFARSFFPHSQAGQSNDISFIISQNATPIALVDCTHNQDTISFFGFPLRVLWSTSDENIRAKASSAILAKLIEIAREKKLHSISITGDDHLDILGPISKACLDAGASAKLKFHAISDLFQPEETLRKGLRKSYKSLINWGKKNLTLVSINALNPDRGTFDAYIDFYAHVAKKQPHTPAVWDLLFDRIINGDGELIVGYSQDDHEMVAGNIIIEENGAAYYFLGAYDRERFEHPIGHWPLYSSILQAKERGNHLFDLGEIFAQSHDNAKEFSIGFFKKGFTKKIVSHTSWQVTF